MNPFAEPGELVNLQGAAIRETVMTPQRVDQYLMLVQFALDCASPECFGHALPPEVVTRAARILKLAPTEIPYLPPALPVSDFAEPVHLADE